MMTVIIDRFEGDYAICETSDTQMIDIPRTMIPLEAKEGDVLIVGDDKIILDNQATEKRRRHIEELTKNLWK